MKLQILVAEPQEILRAGLCAIFAEDPRVATIFEASTIKELQGCLLHQRLDLVLIDQCLLKDYSILNKNVIVLAEELDLALLQAAYNSGARGYLAIDSCVELLRSILRLEEKAFLIGPSMAPQVMEHFARLMHSLSPKEQLTPREKEIVSLLMTGMDRASVARQLHITEATLKTHISNIEKKRAALNAPVHNKSKCESVKNTEQGCPVKLPHWSSLERSFIVNG